MEIVRDGKTFKVEVVETANCGNQLAITVNGKRQWMIAPDDCVLHVYTVGNGLDRPSVHTVTGMIGAISIMQDK
jgi:hypothetical protein